MKFPLGPHKSAGDYWASYRETIVKASASVDATAVDRAAELLDDLFTRGSTLYVCGNGGSAAIANHLLCDFAKGIQTDTPIRPKVVSLSSHLELILAIGNDIDFAEVFAYQVRSFAAKGDALMTISASGNSENVVRAIHAARDAGAATIALTGFQGGRCSELADVNIHVAAANYGIVEDVHQSLMHVFAQYLRLRRMDGSLIAAKHF